jgi:hypothetical protein
MCANFQDIPSPCCSRIIIFIVGHIDPKMKSTCYPFQIELFLASQKISIFNLILIIIFVLTIAECSILSASLAI